MIAVSLVTYAHFLVALEKAFWQKRDKVDSSHNTIYVYHTQWILCVNDFRVITDLIKYLS